MFQIEEGRWYCYRDDQVYLEKEQEWQGTFPAVKRRGEISAGNAAKIGGLIGFLHATIEELDQIPFQLALGMLPTILDPIGALGVCFRILAGLIGGFILGYVFAKLAAVIPGRTITRKAVVAGFIPTLLEAIGSVPHALNSNLILAYGSVYPLMLATVCANVLILDPLLAYLYGWKLARREESDHVLLAQQSQTIRAL